MKTKYITITSLFALAALGTNAAELSVPVTFTDTNNSISITEDTSILTDSSWNANRNSGIIQSNTSSSTFNISTEVTLTIGGQTPFGTKAQTSFADKTLTFSGGTVNFLNTIGWGLTLSGAGNTTNYIFNSDVNLGNAKNTIDLTSNPNNSFSSTLTLSNANFVFNKTVSFVGETDATAITTLKIDSATAAFDVLDMWNKTLSLNNGTLQAKMFKTNTAFTVSAGSKLSITGTFDTVSDNSSSIQGNMTVDGEFSHKNSKVLYVQNASVIVNTGGSFSSDRLHLGSDMTIAGGTAYAKLTSNVISSINISSGTLTLDAYTSGADISFTQALTMTGGKIELDGTGTFKFDGGIDATNAGTNKLTFDLGTAKLELASITGENLLIDFIIAEGESWNNNSLLVKAAEESQLNGFTYTINGQDAVATLTKEGDGYYINLSTAAVPEPAEWAAIFGAIALGFVAYRKRK